MQEHLTNTIRDRFRTESLVKHQLDSYNYFLVTLLPQIIAEHAWLTVDSQTHKTRHVIHISNARIGPSVLTQMQARHKGEDYAIPLLVDIEQRVYGSLSDTHRSFGLSSHIPEDYVTSKPLSERKYEQLLLMYLPLMTRSVACLTTTAESCASSECVFDDGGIFIIGGSEKTILAQERPMPNFPFVIKSAQPFMWTCEVRSWRVGKYRSTSTMSISVKFIPHQSSKCRITCCMPFLEKTNISISVVLRALGVPDIDTATKILVGIHTDNNTVKRYVKGALSHENVWELDEDAFNDRLSAWAGKGMKDPVHADKRQLYVKHVLATECFPHISNSSVSSRVVFLARIIQKTLLVAIGERPQDDRDNYAHKRLHCAGALLATQVRQLVRSFFKGMVAQIHRHAERGHVVDMSDLINPKRMSLRKCLTTGRWGMKMTSATGGGGQEGVVQLHTRMNRVCALSHSRRLNTPLNRDGKQSAPRQLRAQQYGSVCAVETVEGKSCGLLQALTVNSHVRLGTGEIGHRLLIRTVFDCAREIGICVSDSDEIPEKKLWYYIYINGEPIGSVKQGIERLVHELRIKRSSHDIPNDVSITFAQKDQEVRICSDVGAVSRAVLWRYKYNDAIDALRRFNVSHVGAYTALEQCGAIVYLDKDEESQVDVRVAVRVADFINDASYTHVELTPTSILGLSALMIPLANHNQAPRNVYATQMSKQALGHPSLVQSKRFDTTTLLMNMLQQPLVRTLGHDIVQFSLNPSAQEPVVALISGKKKNEEDSIAVNRRSLELGMFTATCYKAFLMEERGSAPEKIIIARPSKQTLQNLVANFDKLPKDGCIVTKGTLIDTGDVLVAAVLRTKPLGRGDTIIERDRSLMYTLNEQMIVDEVFVAGIEGSRTVRIRLRAVYEFERGDKVAAASGGQKGVAGVVMNPEDMPFTTDGLVPDLIINTHAIPSRMTIGLLLEMLLGQVACCEMKYCDGTAFSHPEGDLVEKAAVILRKHGWNSDGKRQMYCGLTGRPLEASVFLGPASYFRLRHFAAFKIHARSQGMVQALTRQPNEGRARQGGLRYGNMEVSETATHGASAVLRDRMCGSSDKSTHYICGKCGIFAIGPKQYQNVMLQNTLRSESLCPSCKKGTHVKQVTVPWAWSLLTRELEAAHLGIEQHLADTTQEEESELRDA